MPKKTTAPTKIKYAQFIALVRRADAKDPQKTYRAEGQVPFSGKEPTAADLEKFMMETFPEFTLATDAGTYWATAKDFKGNISYFRHKVKDAHFRLAETLERKQTLAAIQPLQLHHPTYGSRMPADWAPLVAAKNAHRDLWRYDYMSIKTRLEAANTDFFWFTYGYNKHPRVCILCEWTETPRFSAPENYCGLAPLNDIGLALFLPGEPPAALNQPDPKDQGLDNL